MASSSRPRFLTAISLVLEAYEETLRQAQHPEMLQAAE
jgi:hypothetical protein